MREVVYRIETPRLVIRCWGPEDAAIVKAAEDASRQHLRRYMLWAARGEETITEAAAKLRMFRARFDRGEDFMFGVFDKNDERVLMGSAGLHERVGAGGIEIGYWVHAAHVRRGIATEAAGALTRVAFEVGAVRWVEIRCATSNAASAGIPRALGFTHEATLHERLEDSAGNFEDELLFTMLARDYPTSAAKRIAYRAFDAAGRPFTST